MRFKKAFVGKVSASGKTYNIQDIFHTQGYFGIKVMGANFCLLEELEDGELKALAEDAKDWLVQWFEEINEWRPNIIDQERVTWLRIFGVLCHA